MGLFSHRKGLKAVRTTLQTDSIDTDLRNLLWNALTETYWNQVRRDPYRDTPIASSELESFVRILWHNYFKKPLDTMGTYWPKTYTALRDHFFTCSWNEVYDFIEFAARHYPNPWINSDFMGMCNRILESELSAYRFVGGRITQITSEEEVKAIEEAIGTGPGPATLHLNTALERLADRKSPDYRNSIKESISAVEALSGLITGDPKATLGKAIKKLKEKVPIHPALEQAFDKLYGYTSDAEGIRHALLDEEPHLSFEDAKFMLVSCSAFTNYLIAKAAKSGIKL